MMMRRAVVAVLALVAFLSVSADAEADRNHYTVPAGASLGFKLEGSNGYRIRVSAYLGVMSLTTVKGGITTEYYARNAHVDANHLRARLPGLGLISVRFHQQGLAHHLPLAGCDGPRATVRRGVVRGTIRFVGERDYTKVAAREADAESAEWEKQRCRYGTPGHVSGNQRDQTNRFQAWGDETSSTFFGATKYRPGVLDGGRVVFTAETSSYRGSLRVARRTSVLARASAFQIPEPDTYPEHVILTPPPPFSGTGTFARTPESVFTWEGDLSVQFPGIDPIPLTGPSFEPNYCVSRSCVSQNAESETGAPRPAR